MSEGIPNNAPKYLGNMFYVKAHCDSDHVGENITCPCRSVFVVKLNIYPIYWFSNNQTSVEVIAFGSGFVVSNIAVSTSRTCGIRSGWWAFLWRVLLLYILIISQC